MSYSLFMIQLCTFIMMLTIVSFSSLSVFAQDQNAEDEKTKKFGTVYGLHTGPLLPNQIKGMTEIMPLWGAHYAFPVRKGHLEIGIANAHAKGVDYYNGSVSMRGDYNIEDMFAIVFAGLDTHYYAPAGEPFGMFFGAHVGGGFAANLGDLLWFRADMKFNVNPGTALYIGFGLEWRLPEGGEGGDEQK